MEVLHINCPIASLHGVRSRGDKCANMSNAWSRSVRRVNYRSRVRAIRDKNARKDGGVRWVSCKSPRQFRSVASERVLSERHTAKAMHTGAYVWLNSRRRHTAQLHRPAEAAAHCSKQSAQERAQHPDSQHPRETEEGRACVCVSVGMHCTVALIVSCACMQICMRIPCERMTTHDMSTMVPWQ